MKKYNDKELKLLGTSVKGLIAQKLGCSYVAVEEALKNGKGGKRKTALYLRIIEAAENFLETTKAIDPLEQ